MGVFNNIQIPLCTAVSHGKVIGAKYTYKKTYMETGYVYSNVPKLNQSH